MKVSICVSTVTVVDYLKIEFLSRSHIPSGRYSRQKAVYIIIKLAEFTYFNRIDVVLIASQHKKLLSGRDGKTIGKVIGQISILYGRGQIIQSKGVAVFIKRLPEMVRELPVDVSYDFQLKPV